MFDWSQIFGKRRRKRTDGTERQKKFEKREEELPQPEWNRLKKKLLNIGGEAVVPPMSRDETPRGFLKGLLNKGKVIDLPVRVNEMKSSNCHQNSAKLWRDEGARVATGLGLTKKDGLWRLHTWAVKDGTIIETTVPRNVYYGVVLSDKKSKLWAENEGVI